jgi:GYF domain 2
MAQYTLHLPDGTEYGPVDLATLQAWRHEGRIPHDALVWREGTPDWVSAEALLGDADAITVPVSVPVPLAARAEASAASPVAAAAPARPSARPSALVSAPVAVAPAGAEAPSSAERRARPRPAVRPDEDTAPPSALPRVILLTVVGLVVVGSILAGAVALMLPVLQKRRAMAEIQRYALADRTLGDAATGLAIELPQGWVALRPDNPLVTDANARLELAQPALGAVAGVLSESLPRFTGPLDAYADRILAQRRLLQPSLKEAGRSDLRFAKGQARVVKTSNGEGQQAETGALAVFQDGWIYFTLQATAPTAAGEKLLPELQSLGQGIRVPSERGERVQEALDRTVREVPELSRGAVEELVRERLSKGEGTDDLSAAALRVVSQGLYTLRSAETQELGEIYAQVYGPIPEAERVRLARYVQQVRAGIPVAGDEAQAARQLLRQGIDSLPEEARARLQALNDKAFRAGLGPP